jgi:hypothetical protein
MELQENGLNIMKEEFPSGLFERYYDVIFYSRISYRGGFVFDRTSYSDPDIPLKETSIRADFQIFEDHINFYIRKNFMHLSFRDDYDETLLNKSWPSVPRGRFIEEIRAVAVKYGIEKELETYVPDLLRISSDPSCYFRPYYGSLRWKRLGWKITGLLAGRGGETFLIVMKYVLYAIIAIVFLYLFHNIGSFVHKAP